MDTEYYMRMDKSGNKKLFAPESMFLIYNTNKFKGKDVKFIKIQNKLTILTYILIFLGFVFSLLFI